MPHPRSAAFCLHLARTLLVFCPHSGCALLCPARAVPTLWPCRPLPAPCLRPVRTPPAKGGSGAAAQPRRKRRGGAFGPRTEKGAQRARAKKRPPHESAAGPAGPLRRASACGCPESGPHQKCGRPRRPRPCLPAAVPAAGVRLFCPAGASPLQKRRAFPTGGLEKPPRKKGLASLSERQPFSIHPIPAAGCQSRWAEPLRLSPPAASPGQIRGSNPQNHKHRDGAVSVRPRVRCGKALLKEKSLRQKRAAIHRDRRPFFLHAERQSRRALSGATARRAGPEKTGLWPALPPPRSRPLWGLTAPC